MSARDELAAVLQRWLQLTRQEASAIEAAAWPALARIQASKAPLRDSFVAAARQCATEDPSLPFRAEVGRIISLLTRNAEVLAAQLRRARARQKSLNEARRNLGKIRQSYIQPARLTAWNSYS